MTPIPTRRPVAPPIGRTRRLRLTEPVLFYTVPAVAFLVLGMVLEAAAAGEWSGSLLLELPGLLLLAGAIWAARASVYSTPSTIKAIREAVEHR